MSKYFYRIFTIIDLHFGAMQPCSSGLGMTLEASDFLIRPKIGRLLYTTAQETVPCYYHFYGVLPRRPILTQ